MTRTREQNPQTDPSFRNKVKQLNKNGLPKKLLDGVTAGAEKTIGEWAEEFGVSRRRIEITLTGLRKRKHLLYPIGTIAGFKPKQGLIVNIMEKKADILETMERHDLVYLAPQLESIVRIIEQAVTKYPQLRGATMALLRKSLDKLNYADSNPGTNPGNNSGTNPGTTSQLTGGQSQAGRFPTTPGDRQRQAVGNGRQYENGRGN